MSADQQIALALRKERLLMRIGQQREQLVQYGGWLEKPCAVADKIIGAGRYARAHPWATGAAAGVAALMGRRHVFRVAGYAWSAWRAWRFIGGWAREAGLMQSVTNK